MSRLWSSGFELNSLTAGIEWTAISNAATPQTIQTTTVRSGTYALKTPTGIFQNNVRYQFQSTNNTGPFFARIYFRFASLPTGGSDEFFALRDSSQARQVGIRLTAAGVLQLLANGAGSVGVNSSTLSSDTWYQIELKIDATPASGSRIVEASIDGTVFTTYSTATSGGVTTIAIGSNLGQGAGITSGEYYFDDIAINDSSGSFQNSYPGDSKIIHLLPDAAGDVNTFATQVGGTAGAANNFTRVDEVTPDDSTTYNGSSVLNEEDLFNVGASGIGASDTVNVVSVGGRFRNDTADATTALKFEIEKTSGGTISQSAAIVPNSTTWKTNASAVPTNYPLTTYQDPDSSNWTQTTLDSMQVGYKLTTANVNRILVSTMWVLVDYTPDTGGSETLSTDQYEVEFGTASSTKTQPAIARISNIVANNQPAIARISHTNIKTQPTIARIANIPTSTQPAIARIQRQLTKLQTATASVITNTTETETQPAIARIANVITKTQLSVARIQTTTTKTQSATARIQSISTRAQTAISRIQNTVTKVQSATANIAIIGILTKTQPVIARIANTLTRTQSAIATIVATITKTQPATSRINQTFTSTQPATARVVVQRTFSQSAKARIAFSRTATGDNIWFKNNFSPPTFTPVVPGAAAVWTPLTPPETSLVRDLTPPTGQWINSNTPNDSPFQ